MSKLYFLTAMGFLTLASGSPAQGQSSLPKPSALSDGAYVLLDERVTANQASFFVYKNADSAFNHGFPSGLFDQDQPPDDEFKVEIDPACVDDPGAAKGCSTTPDALDRVRSHVMRMTFEPLLAGEFVGVNFEEPENWASIWMGRGYDLRPATQVVLEACSPEGIWVQFGVGGKVTPFLWIPTTWTSLTIELSSLSPSPPDLADVHILFSVAADSLHTASGGTVLIDNVRFEPLPDNRLTALGLPVATETFGAVPTALPPFAPDQASRNPATTYESSLTLLALAARGQSGDLNNLQLVSDALGYDLANDQDPSPQGAGLPLAMDGSGGLHDGYLAATSPSLTISRPVPGRARFAWPALPSTAIFVPHRRTRTETPASACFRTGPREETTLSG